jgi:indolepyruvate decarboxylase
MLLHTVLFDQLWRAGVRQVFGIPGDFALNLYEALETDGRFELVRFSHEPAVGFAADGCARITGGLGVCVVTYGAGGLNMVNPVACAYAEESPLVVISGGPGLAERARGMHVHHQVKSFDSQLKVYQEVTAYAAILDDPDTAAASIAEAIEVATKLKRPVYLEVPRDLVFAEVAVEAGEPAVRIPVDEGAVREAVDEIVARLRAARRPALIVGVEVHRFKLSDAIIRLAERLQVPVASSFLGRGAVPGRHPLFVGTYLGVASPPELRDVIESSDCVLLVGEHISDTTLGVSADRLSEANLMLAVADDVFIGHHRYQRAPLGRVVQALIAHPALPAGMGRGSTLPSAGHERADITSDRPITVADVIAVLNDFIDAHPDVPLVADTGDALFAAVDIRSNQCVAPAYYATMGFAVPAAIGLEVSSRRRPLVLVGDGAFQMTGPEVAHAPVHGLRPVIVVLNNARWEMLQAFFPEARYNTTPVWPFAKLAELWGGRGETVHTAGDLAQAIDRAWLADRFSIIEVPLAPGDISPVLGRFVEAFKRRVKGS